MKSAITVCLVPEAAKGPFVFHEGLAHGIHKAKELGFDAVEVFPMDGNSDDLKSLPDLLEKEAMQLAAMGTGAGWLRHQWSLTAESPDVRKEAMEFIRRIIHQAGPLNAPAIIGSMQGRVAPNQARSSALTMLGDALCSLAEEAFSNYGVPLLYEPLNRYETNLFNHIGTTAQWLNTLGSSSLRILADLFHMNIEESDLAAAMKAGGSHIGHVHFADSNRSAVGMGHTAMDPIMAALKEIGYDGYLSAEVFPLPDPHACALTTIKSMKRYLGA